MKKIRVILKKKDDNTEWFLKPKKCPALPHLSILGEPQWHCMEGKNEETGPLPRQCCRFAAKDRLVEDGGELYMGCSLGE